MRRWGIGCLCPPWRLLTHPLSSLRKQGPNYQPAQVVTWVPACAGMTPCGHPQSFTPFNRNALPMTLTELSAIAAAAIIGDSSHPVNG